MYKYVLIIGIVLSSLNSFSQEKSPLPLAKFGANISNPLTTQERSFIDEVYGDYAKEFVYNNPQRLKAFKNILRNRVTVKKYNSKDLGSIKNLSKVALVNAINSNLQRDLSYNKNTFNPLKYAFGFFSNNQATYYRFDNTQYLITILPQH